MERQEMFTEFCWENFFESGHLEDWEGNGKDNIKIDLRVTGYDGRKYLKVEFDISSAQSSSYTTRESGNF
jgi:hypothetical protein